MLDHLSGSGHRPLGSADDLIVGVSGTRMIKVTLPAGFNTPRTLRYSNETRGKGLTPLFGTPRYDLPFRRLCEEDGR